MEEKKIAIRDCKNFCFNFDLPKDVDENLKCEFKVWNLIDHKKQ